MFDSLMAYRDVSLHRIYFISTAVVVFLTFHPKAT